LKNLEKLIKKLRELRDLSKDQRQNVAINISICIMQIGIRDKRKTNK